MTQEELRHVLNEHKKWLQDPAPGARANLDRADLTGADLTKAKLGV